jgi:hypothetical protein
LKLKCDEPLSNVAFNLIVRRYVSAYINIAIQSATNTASMPSLPNPIG